MVNNKILLVVEDDLGLQSQLRWCFDEFEVEVAANRQEALVQIRQHQPSVVTLDLGLPPDPGGTREGLATLEEIVNIAPMTKVIIITGNDDRNSAVQAINLGAYDFYLKPVDPTILVLVVERAHRLWELENENQRLQQIRHHSPLHGIIGNSNLMLQAAQTIEKVALTNATVLILGESGTGKELFARALHQLSSRIPNRLVAINCAAIPEQLLESELFGYEQGAFTGAIKQTKGKIECAHGGTLFLDEIGDLPLPLQAKLLRFLQERVIERLGGREEIPVDLRVVCATHQDLEQKITQGLFRPDLFYRISEITISLPPLRDRGNDVLLLARTFLSQFNREFNKAIRGFTRDATTAITHYSWPGNVREVENRIKRAVIMAEGRQLTSADLELDTASVNNADIFPQAYHCENAVTTLRIARETAEIRTIRRALQYANGKISQAAKLLDVTRPTLYSLLEKYQIKVD
ncbi:PEP-CTERM-box response regulator transcription factor [Rhodoferax sp. 4810]|uniref:PEP-CTERM-box response regulator transcription factor n=1 Tax=Thiospirillum jenense TaxID=1653858 RepID=A0A839HQT2_9GAMM|nr:PEP-CTERM-box response regulator transcription factor [Rhodoferax jenense]MBB1127372.1 PEP-CTERM-box response regulator transcription factor [Thiospirillum jenense]